MRLNSNDAMARLTAADPARGLALDTHARAQLWDRILAGEAPREALDAPTPSRQRQRQRRRRRTRTLAIVLPVLLALGGGALAAGIIRIGSPAKPVRVFSNPSLNLGAIAPGTVRMLPITTPDPAGGPEWGMRVLSTTRGLGCVQIGRVVDGKLGALGQDAAFGDDSRFHELPVNTLFDPGSCTALDANHRLFTNVTAGDQPASAWRGEPGANSCVPATSTPFLRSHFTTCPQADERNLYYGLLGPYAKSVTYTLDGQTRTQPTAGPEGAYLIVTRAPNAQQPGYLNGVSTLNGSAPAPVPIDGPITRIAYSDGSVCNLNSRYTPGPPEESNGRSTEASKSSEGTGAASPCTPALQVPVGYLVPRRPPLTEAQVTTPLHTRLTRRADGRYEIALSFTSRVATAATHGHYLLRVHQPQPPYVRLQATHGAIAAGQTVTLTIGETGPPLRPGLAPGILDYVQSSEPGETLEPGVRVGELAVRVP